MGYADPLYRSAPFQVSQRVLALGTSLIRILELSSENVVYMLIATNYDKTSEMLPTGRRKSFEKASNCPKYSPPGSGGGKGVVELAVVFRQPATRAMLLGG
jgi:hypothetical protein